MRDAKCKECDYFEYNSNQYRWECYTSYCMLNPTKVKREPDSIACKEFSYKYANDEE